MCNVESDFPPLQKCHQNPLYRRDCMPGARGGRALCASQWRRRSFISMPGISDCLKDPNSSTAGVSALRSLVSNTSTKSVTSLTNAALLGICEPRVGKQLHEFLREFFPARLAVDDFQIAARETMRSRLLDWRRHRRVLELQCVGRIRMKSAVGWIVI
jgi:hypothetical protein